MELVFCLCSSECTANKEEKAAGEREKEKKDVHKNYYDDDEQGKKMLLLLPLLHSCFLGEAQASYLYGTFVARDGSVFILDVAMLHTATLVQCFVRGAHFSFILYK